MADSKWLMANEKPDRVMAIGLYFWGKKTSKVFIDRLALPAHRSDRSSSRACWQ
jgi:hypothetical protein